MRRQDSNLRPPGYEPDELPTALLRDMGQFLIAPVFYHIRRRKSTIIFCFLMETFVEACSHSWGRRFARFRAGRRARYSTVDTTTATTALTPVVRKLKFIHTLAADSGIPRIYSL